MPYEYEDYGGKGSRTTSWADYQRYQRQHGGGGREGGLSGWRAAHTIIGGPVGIAESARGKSFLGNSDPFDGTTVNDSMTEEVYNSMTPEEWKNFAHMSGQEAADFIASRSREVATSKGIQSKRKAAEDKLAQEEQARKAQQADIMRKVQAFADEMNMPIDQLLKRDDFAKALQEHTQTAAMTAAQGRGLGPGGISTQNADYTSKRALLGYQMQRQQQGQQALDRAYGMINGQGIQAEDLRRYNQGMDLQLQQADAASRYQQYMQNMTAEGNKYGMVGGIIGGAVGGPAGYSAGNQFGQSIGQQSVGGYTPYNYHTPSGAGIRGGGNY